MSAPDDAATPTVPDESVTAPVAKESGVGVREMLAELSPGQRDDLAQQAHAAAVDAMVRAETAGEGQRRLQALLHDLAPDLVADFGEALQPLWLRPPMRRRYPRYGWRGAIDRAVKRRMLTPEYLNLYRRYAIHRVDRFVHGQDVVFQGMVFTGKRVEFRARRDHGRLVLGPWCWIGNDNKLRAHEGQLTLGPKVVMGRDNVINTYLDIEIGEATIIADWVYICDFDHRYQRLDIAIKDQGIVKSPSRIGADVWMGEKTTVLRGVNVGDGSVVASHCLVNKDIAPFSIAVGVPVRVVKSRLPAGMTPDEGLDCIRRGVPIPGDPLEG